jgi:polysaccharide export outer membrane protein
MEAQTTASAGAATTGQPSNTSTPEEPVIGAQGQPGRNQGIVLPGNTPVRAQERRLLERENPPPTPDQPTEFQQMVANTTGKNLSIFGAALFQNVPSTFAPVDNVPVTPDYVIGPDDELNVEAWGQVTLHGRYLVDRNGNINLPQVGTLHVAGLTYAQINSYVRDQMGKVFRNFDLNVTLGQLRSIQIFVVGQARRPGSYTVGSLSTLVNALFATGGPLPQGSLRHIQLRRSGKVAVDFDLYDLLLHGDKSKDVPLLPGDVIYIPPAGPQVAIAGSITNPAIYELSNGATLDDAIQMAGGVTSVAATSQVRVERVFEHAARSVQEVSLDATGKALELHNGDIITVSAIIDRFNDAVTLRGNVANPGRYPWHAGMRIRDLIPSKDVLVTREYWLKRNALGRTTVDYLPLDERAPEGSLHIGTPNAGYENVPPPLGQPQNAGNRGQNNTQATSAPTDSNATVGAALTAQSGVFVARNDVVLSAPEINWSYAVIDRLNPADLTTTLVPFNLGKVVLDGDESQNYELQPNDVITIFSKADVRVPASQQTKYVRLEGEFASAGIYSVFPGETLRQLVQRAGGLTPDAFLYGSDFTRDSVRRLQQQRLNEYVNQLETQVTDQTAAANGRAINAQDSAAAAAAAQSSRELIARLRQTPASGRLVLEMKPESLGVASLPDLPLEDGDRFVVPHLPSNVTVEGQVYSANAFVYRSGRRVKDYLKIAGGPTRDADKRRTFVIHADGAVESSQYTANFNSLKVNAGDTIVVPHQLQKGAALRNLTDIAQVLSGFGLAAAAVEILK